MSAALHRDDGAIEYPPLESEAREVITGIDPITGEHDPRRDGTITTAVPIATMRGPRPEAAPMDHPGYANELVVATPTTDLVVARDLETGLAGLYADERARREARDALADLDPRRLNR